MPLRARTQDSSPSGHYTPEANRELRSEGTRLAFGDSTLGEHLSPRGAGLRPTYGRRVITRELWGQAVPPQPSSSADTRIFLREGLTCKTINAAPTKGARVDPSDCRSRPQTHQLSARGQAGEGRPAATAPPHPGPSPVQTPKGRRLPTPETLGGLGWGGDLKGLMWHLKPLTSEGASATMVGGGGTEPLDG